MSLRPQAAVVRKLTAIFRIAFDDTNSVQLLPCSRAKARTHLSEDDCEQIVTKSACQTSLLLLSVLLVFTNHQYTGPAFLFAMKITTKLFSLYLPRSWISRLRTRIATPSICNALYYFASASNVVRSRRQSTTERIIITRIII